MPRPAPGGVGRALRRDARYRAALDASPAALVRLPCEEADFYDMQHATPACLGRLWALRLPEPGLFTNACARPLRPSP